MITKVENNIQIIGGFVMVLTRKIQLFPVGDKEEIDRVYKYLRDGIFNQNKAMNQYMSALYMATIEDISKED